ncbi:MAG: DUF4833 domain-containing protein [Spirosomataceae bacterium]
MKNIKVIILLILGSYNLVAQNKFPTPPHSANRLFYIQRSNNAHTVVYDANWLGGKTLHPEKPVNVYWIRYDEKVHTQNLSMIQRNLAYGVEAVANSKEKGSYDVRIVAFKKKSIKIKIAENGHAIATMLINGIESQLHKIFVQLEDNDSFCPKVKFIEIFGKNLATGAEIYEKFKP